MQIKFYELNSFKKDTINYYLFYGPNTGLIEETIDKIFKPIFPKDILIYDEIELLNNVDSFKEIILNKSFFDNEKFIIINRSSNKILGLIESLIKTQVKDIKIIIKAGLLDKKSKLRSYFEKSKSSIVTAFYEDNYQILLTMIQRKFIENKINASNEIINLIIEKSKGNRIIINNELEKILSYAKNNHIRYQDILKIINLSENYDITELVNQTLSKNKKKTINILNENNLNTNENILILRTFLNKLKKLKNLKISLEKNKNIEQILSKAKPPIFWKDKEMLTKQLNILSLNEINFLIHEVNKKELEIKKNNQISDQILNNFILENLLSANNVV